MQNGKSVLVASMLALTLIGFIPSVGFSKGAALDQKNLFKNVFENFCAIAQDEVKKSIEAEAKLHQGKLGPRPQSGSVGRSNAREHLRSMIQLRVASYAFPNPAAEKAFYAEIEKNRDEFSAKFWKNFEAKFGDSKGALKTLKKIKLYEGPDLVFEKASCEMSRDEQSILLDELQR